MDEAVDLVAETIETMEGGELVIPRLPAYVLGDLAKAMGAKMDVIGLEKWEKKAESMTDGICSDTVRRMSSSELRDALENV